MKLHMSLSSDDTMLRTVLRRFRAFVIDNGSKFVELGIESVPTAFVDALDKLDYVKKSVRSGVTEYVFATGSYVELTSGRHAIVTAYLRKPLSISLVASDLDKPRESLLTLLNTFMQHPDIQQVTHDKEAAWNGRSNVPRDLAKFLQEHDYAASVVLGIGYKLPLRGACDAINKLVHYFGADAKNKLVHSVVQIGNIIIDLTRLCIGTNYLQKHNCTVHEFNQFWTTVRAVKE